MIWRYALSRTPAEKSKRSPWVVALFFAALAGAGGGPYLAYGTINRGGDFEDPPLTNSEKTALCPWLTDPKLAKDMLNRSKLWDSLYRLNIGNAIPPEWIFARAESDPDYRAALNKKIETDSGISPGLKRLMRLGKDHAEFLGKIKDLTRDLNPGKAIQQEWEEFRKSLNENKLRPMPLHEAENIVRNQMAQQLGIPVHRLGQQISNDAQASEHYDRSVWRLQESEVHRNQNISADGSLKYAREWIKNQLRIEEQRTARLFVELFQSMMAFRGERLWLSRKPSRYGVADPTAIGIQKLKSVDWVSLADVHSDQAGTGREHLSLVAVQERFRFDLLIRSRKNAMKGSFLEEVLAYATRGPLGDISKGRNEAKKEPLYVKRLIPRTIYLKLVPEDGAAQTVAIGRYTFELIAHWIDRVGNTYSPGPFTVAENAKTILFQILAGLHAQSRLADALTLSSFKGLNEFINLSLSSLPDHSTIHSSLLNAEKIAIKYQSNEKLDAVDLLRFGGDLIHPYHWTSRTTHSKPDSNHGRSLIKNAGHALTRHMVSISGTAFLIAGTGINAHKGALSKSDPKNASTTRPQEFSEPKERNPSDDSLHRPGAWTWITEDVLLPTAADSHSWHAEAPQAFLAEYGDPRDAAEEKVKLLDITDRVFNGNSGKYEKPNEQQPKETSIGFSSLKSVIPTDGWIMLPRPHNANELIQIKDDPNDYELVVEDSKTGNVFIKFKGEVNKVPLPDAQWRINYEKRKQQDYDASQILDNERLRNLNPKKIEAVADEMSEAGLNGLSESIIRWVESSKEKNEPLTLLGFVDRISSPPHYYSLAPGGSDFFGSFSLNPYRKFLRFQEGDSLLLKCDYANELLQISLKKIFEDHEDINVLPSRSIVFKKQPDYGHETDSETLVEGYGVTSTYTEARVEHARTIIEIAGKPGAIWLDGTPNTLRKGEVLPNDSFLGATPPVKPSPEKFPKRRKTKPAQMRAQAYIRENQPLQTLEDHAPDLQGEAEEHIKSAPAPDLQVNMAQQRHFAAQKIRTLADKIVELPSLQAISGLNPAPLPLATYRLALKLAAVLEGTGDSKDFMAALFEAYPFELHNTPIPISNQGLVRLWERAVAIEEKRLKELKRISLESRTARYDLAWTLDKTLLDFSRQLLQLSLDGMRTLNPLKP